MYSLLYTKVRIFDMNANRYPILLAATLIGIALLAMFEIIPQQLAQYAPLAVVPFALRGQSCGNRWAGRRA